MFPLVNKGMCRCYPCLRLSLISYRFFFICIFARKLWRTPIFPIRFPGSLLFSSLQAKCFFLCLPSVRLPLLTEPGGAHDIAVCCYCPRKPIAAAANIVTRSTKFVENSLFVDGAVPCAKLFIQMWREILIWSLFKQMPCR